MNGTQEKIASVLHRPMLMPAFLKAAGLVFETREARNAIAAQALALNGEVVSPSQVYTVKTGDVITIGAGRRIEITESIIRRLNGQRTTTRISA